MLEFVKAHLSTILLTSSTLVLTAIYAFEANWVIMLIWAFVSLINIGRLVYAYKKQNK
ncbi:MULTISPECIES: cytochrome O ubiquinol oxidase [Streptococcus]|uniref:cytochrome O ubiquinol oxidase n=1 Tax=Streptococcus TaxID=1301 RepID=UPI0022838711|nr:MULTISPECIES: cytochrome O ubiquinol oxidase [Streptococcus]MCR5052981.1 cytochrome O ubiquinol oxidase [Streptococcus sp.]MCY7184347.1 cytochrome O ubiquinol oxidase [Streptococcus gallolyticus subsp. gallolyticus]MCY7190095.1 cytochrome O ubiquinol oxidase [Streptococcus gallolyticus subsp. gallolyticus]MCY7201546.1 cytochrome O ubiquinol oxidase [Streptococcus gallolyticus subsp. gallolyticus]